MQKLVTLPPVNRPVEGLGGVEGRVGHDFRRVEAVEVFEVVFEHEKEHTAHGSRDGGLEDLELIRI